MRFFIAYLLTDEPKKAHNFLTKNIERQFGFIRTCPPHVTLKSPFESNSIEDAGKVLENFTKTHRPVQMRFNGFGSFEKEVIYADVKISPEVNRIIVELDAALQSIPWMEYSEFDKKRKLHSTLVDKIKPAKVFRQLRLFATLGSFDFAVWLDNIAILKKEKNKWIVYKQYNLK